jgi:hypothetical protein
VVAPVDQVFPDTAEEVNTTEPPAQNVVGPPAVMIGAAGIGLTVTLIVFETAEAQGPSITCTE